jgi:IS30 family transposase
MARRQQQADRALRPAMRSPGRPIPARHVEREFWRLIAQGRRTEDAASEIGVSAPVAGRWFRHAGGMPPLSLAEPACRYLAFQEREEISVLNARGLGVRAIARELRRDPGTISRELRRNAATRSGKRDYRASVAQWKAQTAALRPKRAKLVTNPRLREYVQERLSGQLHRPDGTIAQGPNTTWKGLNKPHRADRRWATAWSPQQIAQRLVVDFPDDEDMRISHEAIYQALYIEGRGALKRELVACLRTGRALRKPRERQRNKPHGHVTADVVLSERPAEVEDRAIPGHWEGDLMIGLTRSAIGTVVERTSRYTLLVHLPRLEGYGTTPPVKNGPALGGYGAIAMKDALEATMTTLPAQLLRSLTWDRGKELSAHAQFKVDTGIAVYFADPYSPWQRGTNENTNGLLRQYFPKGTDLSRWSIDDLLAVQAAINSRPRKVLGWKTPAEVLDEQLRLLHQAGVARTG